MKVVQVTGAAVVTQRASGVTQRQRGLGGSAACMAA